MAYTKVLTDAILQSVADQIGELISGIIRSSQFNSGSFELSDSFELWELDPNYDVAPIQPLEKLANKTGRWHHQIYQNLNETLKPVAFAISAKETEPPYEWSVREVFNSKIAEKIDIVMKKIDNNPNLDGDILTRLLILQNYAVYAFWLVSIKQVYIIGCPRGFRQLRPNQLLTEEAFLTQLRKEGPIHGRYKGR